MAARRSVQPPSAASSRSGPLAFQWVKTPLSNPHLPAAGAWWELLYRPTCYCVERTCKFLLLVRVLSCLFRRLFLKARLEQAYDAGKTSVLRRTRISTRPASLRQLSGPAAKAEVGGLRQSPFRRAANTSSRSPSAATPTGWLFPTGVCWHWKTARFPLPGRITVMPAKTEVGVSVRGLLSAAFTLCRQASSASATTASSPTATALASWNSAANCWPLRAPLYCPVSAIAATCFRHSPAETYRSPDLAP